MLLTCLRGSRHGTDTYALRPFHGSRARQIMVMLFANHSPARCLEYDSLFRQAAAHDPILRWDTIKEDIYVWATTQHHNTSIHPNFSRAPPLFVTDSQYQPVLGPHQLSQAKRLHYMLHTLQKAKKSARGTMRDAARRGKNASSHTSAGTRAARVSTLAKRAPNVLELQRAFTPL